jgi:hypothetical protein
MRHRKTSIDLDAGEPEDDDTRQLLMASRGYDRAAADQLSEFN